MAWVEVTDELPPVGVEVAVFGQYVNPQGPFPTAKRRDPGSEKARLWGQWESAEWRGETGITHWWQSRKKRKSK